MRKYVTMSENDESEKLFGGYINLAQGLWLGGGFAIGMGLGMGFFFLTKIVFISVILFFPSMIASAYFAFKKVHGMTLTKYLTIKKAFDKQKTYILNRRADFDVDVKDPVNDDMDQIYTTSELDPEEIVKRGEQDVD